ncbi:MAG: hypothetical protein J5616_05495 [Bacteroidaceae bacterium]|nr:hypothetical protein [Bacteroidaceae bacterium]
MIVPGYNDDQILKELIDDWPSVKRHAKKVGDVLMKKMPKWCVGLDKANVRGYRDTFRTKNGNIWSTSAYCYDGSKTWWSVTYAMVENGYGTKSYFYLRGMRTPHQYYVELIPHAIRRIRERYINTQQEMLFADKKIQDVCDWAVFDRHECGIFFKSGKLRKGKFEPRFDSEGNIYGIALMKNSMFYGRITPHGNFILKTFINPNAEEEGLKRDFTMMLFGIYKSHNVPKDEKTKETRDKYLTATYCTLPTMRHHLDYYADKFVPLYP